MYKKFFGLSRNPFEISPDPAFLVATEQHNESLANLYYGVRRQKGFVVLTGEVGTGKTLLIKCLLEVLNRDHVAFALVFNPRLSVLEFLQYILGDFGISVSGQNKGEMLLALNNFLIARYRKGLETVLIVDEAQHLTRELLEEIRLLTNLESGQQKLLQIILAGQPELEPKLDAADLRQLKQRVALRCRLRALVFEETHRYIDRRLELAGAGERFQPIFPIETVRVIQKHSGGIPRLVNTICENALIIAYARQSAEVKPEFIDEVAADFRLGETATTSAEGETSAGEKSRLLDTVIRLLRVMQSDEPPTNSNEAPIAPGAKEL